eukprot:3857082-Rhodomonas_salina.1
MRTADPGAQRSDDGRHVWCGIGLEALVTIPPLFSLEHAVKMKGSNRNSASPAHVLAKMVRSPRLSCLYIPVQSCQSSKQ